MKRITFLLMMSIVVLCGNATIEVGSIVKNIVTSGDGSIREHIKTETKFIKFIANRDRFVRYIDHEIPEFKSSEALISSAKIRQYMDMTTNKSICFLMITIGRNKETEIIAYDDVIKVLDAIKILKEQSQKDSTAGTSLKCYYITGDGFQIGYNVNKDNISWYFSVNGNERKFSKDFDFEQAIINIKEKMDELTQPEK